MTYWNYFNEIIIDGELYAHGLSFQDNMKLIKKYRAGESERVKFHVYDMVSEYGFFERYDILLRFIGKIEPKFINLVANHFINGEDDLKKIHSKFISDGYEGTMIRCGNHSYKLGKRHHQTLKYKLFIDDALEILDIIKTSESTINGNNSANYAALCQLKCGNTVRANLKMSHEDRENFYKFKDDYIGKTAEIRFFEYSDGGIPRFPVCVGIRNDK